MKIKKNLGFSGGGIFVIEKNLGFTGGRIFLVG
jgi:hypothetical protein